MSETPSYFTEDNHRDSSARSTSKHPHSDSYASRGSRRRRSRSPSDRSNRPDQSVQSYSIRDLGADSEHSSRSYEGRHGRHRDDSRRARRHYKDSYDGKSDDQYSSSYESEESGSGSESFSQSYVSRRSSHSATPTSTSYASTDRKASSPTRSPNKFRGDVSTWGRTKEEHRCCKHDDSESEYTLSSGLSPRGSEAEQRAEFDPDEAKRALVYNAGLYGRAHTMRREGTAPRTLGIADDLPNRFALEQLNTLAGMASKVQAAIEHNRKVFANRVRLEDRALMKKVLDGWRAARYGSLAKQQLLRRAIARLQRGLLSRAFLAWKDKFHLVDKFLAMRRKVIATINRGRMKRCFLEWRNLCVERYWKNQLGARDTQVHLLERRVEGFEKRPIVVLRKRKQSAILGAWYVAAEGRRRKRLRIQKALRHFRNSTYVKSWNSWMAFVAESKRRKALIRKCGMKIRNIAMVAAWNKWFEAVEQRREKDRKLRRAAKYWQNLALSRAWNTWWPWVQYRKQKKMNAERAIKRMKNYRAARAISAWLAMVAWRKRMRLILERAVVRLRKKQMVLAWEAWWRAIEDRKFEETVTTKEELLVAVKDLREENERLRRDNERFVRLIDSGEWGRGRVAELVSAGEILKGERDALLKLIQSLRREYEAVQAAKVAQDEEMRALKERMLLGGAARNRMLVKGGSSFNALVRAMKQDLVEGGPGAQPAARDPNLLYQVDKLSLDQVTVFPDGELNVQAVASAPGAAAFARPLSAGRGLRHPPVNPAPPVQPMRVPPGLAAGASPHRPPMGRPGPPLAVGAAGPGSSRPVTREDVVARLQSLSKEELDSFEAALRAQKAAAAAAASGGAGPPRPPGVASSSYR